MQAIRTMIVLRGLVYEPTVSLRMIMTADKDMLQMDMVQATMTPLSLLYS
jgi:hypothetical protein